MHLTVCCMPAFHVTLWDFLSHLHPRFMLRYEIFSCTCTHVSCYAMRSSLALAPSCPHVSCYAMRSSLALAPTFHVTLWDLVSHLHHLAPTFHATLWEPLSHLHPRFMLRYEIFSCTCVTHVSCYAMRSSLALAPMFHATLWDLLLHLHPRFMLRYEIFSCTCTNISCYSVRSSLALAPTFYATLWDLLALAPSCTHVSCYAMRSSLAPAPTFHVTLWDLVLHLHHLAPTFHATLWDLLLHLPPRFMLRYEIFSCTCTWNKRSKGSTCGQALVRHCQKFHVQTQLWVPTLESAWQVGGKKTFEIIFLQMTLKIHGKTQSK